MVSLVFKSSLVVRDALNNKLNKDYSMSLDKNGQQKSNTVANVLTIECLNLTFILKTI